MTEERKDQSSVVIIAPHPDDEIIGCYEQLKNPTNKIVVIYSGDTDVDRRESVLMLKEKIDNVKILAEKDLGVYFDGLKHGGNYASFGEEFCFGGSDNPGEIIFEKGNKYFPNMKDDTFVKFGLGLL